MNRSKKGAISRRDCLALLGTGAATVLSSQRIFGQSQTVEKSGGQEGIEPGTAGALPIAVSAWEELSANQRVYDATPVQGRPEHPGEQTNGLGWQIALDGDADMPNQVLFNYTYQLPIGTGKRVNIENRALDEVAGGWSIAGIHTYESGTPLSISSETLLFSQPQTATNGNYVRPNLVAGQPLRTGTSCADFNPAGGNAAAASTYMNSAAFVMPGPLQFGDAPRAFGSARSCPYYNENFTLFKTFLFTEKVNFRLGADFFNIFNRHIWGGPTMDVQSPDFGKIFGLNGSPRSIQINGRLSF